MCDAFVWSFDAIAGLPWLAMIQAIAPVATAFIAWRALANWKRQDKAKRDAEFLDSLTDAIHSFSTLMRAPLSALQFIKLSVAYHIPSEPKNDDPYVAAAIDYIEKLGAIGAKRLSESLEQVTPAYVHIQALSAKGQAMGVKHHNSCREAIAKLTREFGVLQAFAAFIGFSNLNWKNPEIVTQLKFFMTIEPEESRRRMNEGKTEALAWVQRAYAQIYG
ncbi:MAG: hypothetical protein AMXMBFR37_07420 [Steroidobacteraceae bacterium]|jgi:hypothetical protein